MTFAFSFTFNALALVIVYALYRTIRRLRALPYPPGPRGHWLLGNINDVPTEKPWVAYKRMSQELDSPIIHLNVLGMHMIVINDASTAHEIFERRNENYSDRPRMPMVNEVAGFSWNFAFRGYDAHWSACRQFIDSHMSRTKVSRHQPKQIAATHKLLQNLLDSPALFNDHFTLHSARLILDIGYGLEVNSHEDYYIQVATAGMDTLGQTSGKHIVDVLPWTQHLPAWLPGMGWKRRTVDWKKKSSAMRDEPFNAAKATNPSLASSFFQGDFTGNSVTEDVARSTIGTLFTGGSSTIVMTLNYFLLAMLIFPDVQVKAQEELDGILGSDRLPDFQDKDRLPYIRALCSELIRWSCLTPMALPHRATTDDVWMGADGRQYLIPEGAIVFGNTWAILRDPTIYVDPEVFRPERFLHSDKSTGANPPDVAFGYGSRFCAGRWSVEETLFITISSILSTFNISPVSNEAWINDMDSLVIPSWVLEPRPFKCNIIPRHETAARLIRGGKFNGQAS
ncbi:cytochrome P450 [Flagelloscypha sp. PMI_526]|nr:cytochrome P450 [Flagelloscypha sp. PMI_526]